VSGRLEGRLFCSRWGSFAECGNAMRLLGCIFLEGFLRADISAVTDVPVCVDVTQAFRYSPGQKDMLWHELKLGPA